MVRKDWIEGTSILLLHLHYPPEYHSISSTPVLFLPDATHMYKMFPWDVDWIGVATKTIQTCKQFETKNTVQGTGTSELDTRFHPQKIKKCGPGPLLEARHYPNMSFE